MSGEQSDRLDIQNETVKFAFMMANYMFQYNMMMDSGISVYIPERKRNGESELEREKPTPTQPQ